MDRLQYFKRLTKLHPTRVQAYMLCTAGSKQYVMVPGYMNFVSCKHIIKSYKHLSNLSIGAYVPKRIGMSWHQIKKNERMSDSGSSAEKRYLYIQNLL